MAKTIFFFIHILGRTSLCFTDQETQEESVLGGPTPLWVSTYTSYLLYKVPDPFSACRQSNGQNNFFLPHIFGRTSLCFTDQETQEESVLGGPTPLWVSTYTSYLLYKVPDPFSTRRQSNGRNNFFLHRIFGRTSLYFTDQNSGRESAWWTNSLVGQYLHQLSLVQSSRSILRMQTGQNNSFLHHIFGRTSLCFTDQETQEEKVLGGPTPLWVSTYTSYLLYKVPDPFSACRQFNGQNNFFPSSYFWKDQSLLHRPRNSGRESAWWTNSLVGKYLHQLSLVQSSRSI